MRRADGSPVAREDGLLVERIGAETVIYDVERKEAHCLTPLATAVFAHCDGRRSISEIAELVAAELGDLTDVEMVKDALAQLEKRELLIVPSRRFSRREVVGKTAALTGAVMTVPLVASVPVAQAVGCGGVCNTSSECTSICPTCSKVGTGSAPKICHS